MSTRSSLLNVGGAGTFASHGCWSADGDAAAEKARVLSTQPGKLATLARRGMLKRAKDRIVAAVRVRDLVTGLGHGPVMFFAH